MSVAVNYRLISQNLDRQLELTAKQGPVKLESDHYAKNAPKIRSIDEFLEDTRTFRFAMIAFGLEDFAFAKGYMRKILEEGVTERSSLANRTTDPRFREFATAFNFAEFGETTMLRAATGQEVLDRYVRQTLEVNAGQDDEGVRLALYFERKAPGTLSPYELLADKALAKVVRTALGLPKEFAAADIDKQAEVIGERINLEELNDPEALNRLLTRFTALWDLNEGTTQDPLLGLFNNTRQPSISLDLAMSLNSLRLGGR